MKIEPHNAERFLSAPGTCRAILLHGSDEGLIRQRGAALTRLVAGSLNDVFRVAELERDGWSRLADEMMAISMVGGRRVVRIRDAGDAILDQLKAALKTRGDALIVLEAPELGRGKLRPYMEAQPEAAALACYPEEGKALQSSIRAVLQQAGVAADAEALAWLAEVLGGDRHLLTAELEKLALLASGSGRIDVDLARDCVGASAGSTADAALLAAMAGDVAQADAQTGCALADGLAGVALMRIALQHLQKMHQARLRMDAGASAEDAVRAMRPPVYFKIMAKMLRGLTLWRADSLAGAIEEARQVEMSCKQTGSRQDLLAQRFVNALARQSHQRARRVSPAMR